MVLWSEVVSYIGKRMPFGTHTVTCDMAATPAPLTKLTTQIVLRRVDFKLDGFWIIMCSMVFIFLEVWEICEVMELILWLSRAQASQLKAEGQGSIHD
jgi:hypothetical protein